MDPDSIATISVVIPTLDREQVLLETIGRLLDLAVPPEELIVVDQTAAHTAEVKRQLERLENARRIRWIRREKPSIPAAMNAGLVAAKGDIVLFLDDDVEPRGELISAHREAHGLSPEALIAGQVLQPGEEPEPLADAEFRFRSNVAQPATEFMGGNFSIRRMEALEGGGFDEKFVGAAYRFESDFALRWRNRGGSIRFVPAASIRHLRAESGGTRSWGNHLRTARPSHAVGEYYFLLRHRPARTSKKVLSRWVRSVWTRHHLRRPWWIPITLFAESWGLAWAACLAVGEPRLVTADTALSGAPS